MVTKIKTTRHYAEVLSWLQENVGNLYWSQPIIAWHGEGWHMKNTPDINQGLWTCYTVEFEDNMKALLFALWV